jgi:transposase-like protein
MKLGFQLHVAGLSLSDTVSVLECLGVDRCRSTVHNLVQKAGLQPASDKSPNHVAVDETVIQLNNQSLWLYTAVNSDTNESLHMRVFPTRTIVLTKQFLQELTEKHDVADNLFLVDDAPVVTSCPVRAFTPISTRHTWKSECRRTAVQRTKAPY